MRYAVFSLLLGLLVPFVALGQDSAAPSKTERIVGGLLDFGAAVMKQRAEKKQEDIRKADATADEASSGTMTQLGKSVGVLVNGMRDPQYLAEKVASVIRETGEVVLREYLEEYKAEGRAYTRELANIITERIINHEKVASTLHSIRMLCWGVVIYLSVITLLIFYMLWRMKCSNERVLKAIEELRLHQKSPTA